MTDKEKDEMEVRIHPFTVKDALYLHDKKLDELKNLNNQTERIVGSFEDKFKTLMERINEGVSPTMRRIEDKQGTIEKALIQVEANLDVAFAKVTSRIDVIDNRFSDKFVEVDRWMSGIRGLLWKVIGWGTIAALGGAFSTWLYVQQIKSGINAIPTVMDAKPARRAAK